MEPTLAASFRTSFFLVVVCFMGSVMSQAYPTLSTFTIPVPGYANADKLDVSGVVNFADPSLFSNGATSVRAGLWSDPGTWSTNQVPTAGTWVLVEHVVVFDSASTPDLGTVAVASGGVLTFATATDTRLNVDTLFVAEGGILLVGSVASPIASTATAEIVFTNVPVNANGRDAYEWGHGLLCLGECELVSADVPTPFMRMSGEMASSGENSFTLHVPEGAPASGGWRAGDRLLFPDTRQLSVDLRLSGVYSNTLNYGDCEHQLTIDSVAAGTPTAQGSATMDVTLSSNTQYAHLGMRNAAGEWDLDDDGAHRFTPMVANMRRNIRVYSANPGVVESNNPNVATRGHVITTGNGRMTALGVHFYDLGRTRLMSVASDAPNSPNQIGRYALHFHHAIGTPRAGPITYVHYVAGCVIERSAKWALAVHNTHYSYFGDNVIFVASGAGFILEDGNENENVIEGNLVVGVYGTGVRASDATSGGGLGIATEGTGYWLHGIFSDVRDNYASTLWVNPNAVGPYSGIDSGGFGFGYSIFNRHAGGDSRLGWDLPIPLAPGSRNPADWVVRNAVSGAEIRFDGNEFMGAAYGGLTIWSIGRQAFESIEPVPDYVYINDFTCWAHHNAGIFWYQLSRVVFNRYTVRSDAARYGGSATIYARGTTASDYVATDLVVLDCDIQGTNGGLELPDLRTNRCTRWPDACEPYAGDSAQPQIVVKGGFIAAVVAVYIRPNWDKNGDSFQNGDSRIVIDGLVTQPIENRPCDNCWREPHNWANIFLDNKCGDATNLLSMDEVIVLNWQGVPGDDFQLFYREQASDFVWDSKLNNTCCNGVPFPTCSKPVVGTPELGIDNLQLQQTYGYARSGQITPCNATMEGMIGSLICDGGGCLHRDAYVCPIIAQNVQPFVPDLDSSDAEDGNQSIAPSLSMAINSEILFQLNALN